MDTSSTVTFEKLFRRLPNLSVGLLVAAYPLALVPALAGIPLSFHISLPVFLWASLACLLGMLSTPVVPFGLYKDESLGARPPDPRVGHALYAGALGLTLWITTSALFGRTPSPRWTLETIGMFCVPLFFALAPRRWLPRHLPAVLACLWAVQILAGTGQRFVGFSSVGTAGNRNWFATLVVALVPWTWRLIMGTRTSRVLKIFLSAAVAFLALFFAYGAHCRATWLFVLLYGPVLCLGVKRLGIVRLLPLAALVIAGVLFLGLRRETVSRYIREDIRLPLYAQSLRLIAARPVIGSGPGTFRREFVLFRSPEHKSRLVAAAVTEHPHNEALHLSATVGIPATLLWLVILLPVVLRPPRQTLFWYAVHFTAWMIVGHGMLDKTLVQPPTNILGLACAGLLWRPRLPFRLSSGARPEGIARMIPPVFGAACAYALFAGVQTVATGFHFRAANLAESAGNYEEAYRHYAASTHLDPRNVKTHAYAGICANNKLRDPVRALLHLKEAQLLEPDFAHLNGEIGLSLGAQGKHKQAFPFFQRDAMLYPFDLLTNERFYKCAIATDQLSMIIPLYERLGSLRARTAQKRLGSGQVRQFCQRFADSVEAGDAGFAVAVANALVRPLEETAVDPGYPGKSPVSAGFTSADFRAWESRARTRAELLAGPSAAPEDRLPIWLATVRRDPIGGPAGVAPRCEQLGWRFAYFARKTSRAPELLLVHADKRFAVGVVADGSVKRGTSLNELLGPMIEEGRFAGADGRMSRVLRIPVDRAAYEWKHQALAQILNETLGKGVPFSLDPALGRGAFWTEEIATVFKGRVEAPAVVLAPFQ